MYTNRDFVSQIRSMSKLLSSDQMITDRTILREGKDAANLLVKQSLDKRKLWQSPNLFTTVPCLEMERAPLAECCEYTSPRDVARSVKKLPRIGEGVWGLAIQGVFSVDNMKKFKETTPTRYANILKLGLKTNDVFYWMINDHLYVSTPDTEAVNFFAYFTEAVTNDLLFAEDCACKPTIPDICTNPLDHPFHFPADKIADIKNIVYRSLMQTYFQLPVDRTSNNNDETSK